MTIDSSDMLNSILKSLDRIDYIKPEDIPNIDLYMDQVTTFMEQQLGSTKRHDEDKILTKTMINNYAKNHLLPPPDKKKYGKEHVLLLIFIYYFKNILSIGDIDKLLDPITELHFHPQVNASVSLEDIYNEVFSLEKAQVRVLAKDIVSKFNIASKTFEDAKGEDAEYLHYYAFICMLSFDVYVKKLMIEKLIDLIPSSEVNDKKSKKDKPS